MSSTSSETGSFEITVVDADDWLGLYVNGELALEGHGRSRHADILAFGAKHSPYTVRLVFADLTWMEGEGRMPSQLADVIVASESEPRAELAAQ